MIYSGNNGSTTAGTNCGSYPVTIIEHYDCYRVTAAAAADVSMSRNACLRIGRCR